MRKLKNILYFQYPWRLWRTRLAGIYRYAARAGWNVQVVEHGLTAMPVVRELEYWRPDGCIVEGIVMECPGSKASDFGRTPVVFCDANREKAPRRFFGVEHDSAATAVLAARELLSLGFDDYAFVGNIRPHDWSRRREQVFAREVAAAGCAFHSFASGRDRSAEAFHGSNARFGRNCAAVVRILYKWYDPRRYAALYKARQFAGLLDIGGKSAWRKARKAYLKSASGGLAG